MLVINCFFFKYPGTTEICPLPLHDPLPIYAAAPQPRGGRGDVLRAGGVGGPVDLPRLGDVPVLTEPEGQVAPRRAERQHRAARDRKSTRLNSSHANISYAVFCLKKRNR